MRISNSFSEDEIKVLDLMQQTALRGGSLAVVARHPAFASLCRKIHAMKSKVNELKRATHEQSSVGSVAAPLAEANKATDSADAHEDLATAV
jgi:hypothetical protein